MQKRTTTEKPGPESRTLKAQQCLSRAAHTQGRGMGSVHDKGTMQTESRGRREEGREVGGGGKEVKKETDKGKKTEGEREYRD